MLIIFVVENFFMIVYSNAKINIGLNILSRRQDGYHNIASVFYPIKNLYDYIEVVKSNKYSIVTTGINLGSGVNLCTTAFNIIKKKYNIGNVKIHIHKKIPIGSGLGGGSSNAASVINILNKLFSLNLNCSQLEKISLKVGADCPFFIHNSPKYVEGVGDIINDIDLCLSNYEIKFKHSETHISTKEAYSDLDFNSFSDKKLNSAIRLPIESWKENIVNDFEEKIFLRYPHLKKNKMEFYEEGAIYSSMTGTGSTIFGIFKK